MGVRACGRAGSRESQARSFVWLAFSELSVAGFLGAECGWFPVCPLLQLVISIKNTLEHARLADRPAWHAGVRARRGSGEARS